MYQLEDIGSIKGTKEYHIHYLPAYPLIALCPQTKSSNFNVWSWRPSSNRKYSNISRQPQPPPFTFTFIPSSITIMSSSSRPSASATASLTQTPGPRSSSASTSHHPSGSSSTGAINRNRQYTHLNAQLAQLNAQMADMENLVGMTAVQAEYIKGLGGWWGGT